MDDGWMMDDGWVMDDAEDTFICVAKKQPNQKEVGTPYF